MPLPIDPDRLTADDIGEERATLEMDHEEAVAFVRECCLEAGFGIPSEFSPAGLLNEKVDADRDPYYVLGAYNPEMADRGLDGSGRRLYCRTLWWLPTTRNVQVSSPIPVNS